MADDSKRPDRQDPSSARSRFRACIEAEASWRKNALTDLKFRAGTDGDRSYQWPDAIQTSRDQAGRPCLTINRLDSFVKQVTNQQRQAGPAMQIVPINGDADEETAEALQGLIRHIQNVSDGEVAIDTAFEHAATQGKGFIRVITEYEDEETGAQEILIKRIRNPFTVYCDPAAMEPDLSDMRYAFIVEDVPMEEFKLLYPDSDLAKGTIAEATLGQGERLNWFPGGSVRVADYYFVKDTVAKKGQRTLKTKSVVWQKITGLEVLDEIEIPITRIPIVPVFGDEFDVEGKLDYRGMIRNARDPQRMFNFWVTAMTEQIALAPKAPFLITARQREGFERFWDNANAQNYSSLVWNDADAEGNTIATAPPSRNVAEPPIQAMGLAIKIADDNLKQVMQLYDPSLGQRKADQSGRAILALQQQGEIGNINYIDNLKRSLRSLGRLLLQMIRVYYDVPRVRRILGKDEQPQTVMFHAGNPPQQSQEELEATLGVEKVFDVSVGRYDVTVTTGPNFISKRQEAVASMLELAKADPQVIPVIGDLLVKNMDWPGSYEMAARLKKMLPPPLQDKDEGDPAQQMQQMQQQLQQLGQQHDLLVKELDAKTKIIETDQVKIESEAAMKLAELASRERIAVLQAETQQAINAAKLGATADQTALKGKLDQIELLLTHAHEATQAHLDRDHAMDQAAVEPAEPVAEGAPV